MNLPAGTPRSVSDEVEGKIDSREPSSLRALRIGFISLSDSDNPDFLSGMPFSARRALARQPGVEVVLLGAQRPSFSHRSLLGDLAGRIGRRLEGLSHAIPHWDDYGRVMRAAAAESRRIETQIANAELDVVFGLCIGAALAQLRTELPVFYAGDATWRLLHETYPQIAKSNRATAIACEKLERATLRRIAMGYFASERTLESAIEDYGMPPEKVRLVPLGANVFPEPGEVLSPLPPGPEELRLLAISIDPERKRLDFCVSVVELLAQKTGRSVRLVHIGIPTARARSSALVTCRGYLRLSDPEHRRLLQQDLRSCHLLLLPSVGEVFGIAPCEAAHFGRPSVVSDVGGLPTVVHHGQTGLVLPLSTTAADYAQAIEELWSAPETYARMSRQCLERARSVFTWDAWAAAVVRGIRTSLAAPRI